MLQAIVAKGPGAKDDKPANHNSKKLLQLIVTSRNRGLYPPQSMNLGFPAPPARPSAGSSSAPSWINGPKAKKEVAMGRLWRPTWDKAIGVGDPPPVPRGVAMGLWSTDLPDEDRHDLMRNLLMDILRREDASNTA